MEVCLTTDHPNAGPFIRYPRIISWLMSNQRRMEMIENGEVHKWVQKRTTLPTLEREYDFNDIAIITRAAILMKLTHPDNMQKSKKVSLLLITQLKMVKS